MIEKQEQEIIDLLALAWNEFLHLEEQHICDREEFMRAIHQAQHLVMIRETRRNHSEIFLT